MAKAPMSNASDVNKSRRIAGLIGPVLITMVTAEMPFIQPGLYLSQTPVGVYTSGLLFFVAGLAIVQAHNLWTKDWRILVTLCGWAFLILGLMRTFSATKYSQAVASVTDLIFIVIQTGILLVGIVLTYKAYRTPPLC